MTLITEAYQAWGAEVVFITSNFQGNKEMMEGCKTAGIPAFVRDLSWSMAEANCLHRAHFGTFNNIEYFINH